MCEKPLMNSVLDRTVTKEMIGKMDGMTHACKSICLNILKVKVILVSFEVFNDKEINKRENYWMRTLKTYAPFRFNIKESV